MAERRRYTKRQKVSAVTLALASSTLAASEQAGIPESTLRYWMVDPEFAELRDKARAELAPLATTAAFLAWMEAIRLLREGKMEPRDVLFFAGIAMDKSQLLHGAATARLEARDITANLDDHERAALKSAIDAHLVTRQQDDSGTPGAEALAAVEDAGA